MPKMGKFYLKMLKFYERSVFQVLSKNSIMQRSHITKTVEDLCSTKVSFRQANPEVAKRISEAFGKKEIMEIQKGVSYGANEVRDGVNLSSHIKQKNIVSASELQNLKNFEAYIKLAENFPITKMKFKFLKL
ncbi:MAG: Coupling protein TraD [Chlamydiae bacterium]|nr:Coupling protein TraD [Chlamydiota bacterium]